MIKLPAQTRLPDGLAVPRVPNTKAFGILPASASDAAFEMKLRAVMADLQQSRAIIELSMATVQSLLDGDIDDQLEVRQYDLAALGLAA